MYNMQFEKLQKIAADKGLMYLRRRFTAILASGYRQLNDPYYQGFAAQVAFYLLLSVVPTIILLSQILGVFSLSLELLSEWALSYLPAETVNLIIGLFDYVPPAAGNAVFVIVVLWSASRAQFAMMRITNYTFSGGMTTGKGYLRDRLRAVFTIAVTLFTVTFALVVLVYGQIIINVLVSHIIKGGVLLEHLNRFWGLARWPAAMALYFLMVSFNYYILPIERVKFRKILPGSILASVGMLIVTGAFSIYIENIANYDIVYGSLASIVALLFWFYLLSWTLGLGIIFNRAWNETRGIA